MPKHFVVIPFNVPWNWSTDYLNQTAFELGKRGDIVLCYLHGDTRLFRDFINPFSKEKIFSKYSDNIYLLKPVYYLPFRRFKIIRDLNSTINRFILRVVSSFLAWKNNLKFRIFWIFDPNLLFVFNKFKRYFLLYDCVDYFPIGTPDEVKITNQFEKRLCKKADLVVANSHVLQNHLKKYRDDVKLVPQGFRVQDFELKSVKSIDLKLKKPVIGFVGAVNYRLDYKLLINLVSKNPKWNFVIWGPVLERDKIDTKTWEDMNTLLSLPNVKNGKSKDKKELPGIIRQFDIGMIPYDLKQDFNKNCYPMKLFEYFYSGLPVISTPIEELKYIKEIVLLGKDENEWQKSIEKILAKPQTKEEIKKKKEFSIQNSWTNKVGQITSHLPNEV